jgi:hypothetical protein
MFAFDQTNIQKLEDFLIGSSWKPFTETRQGTPDRTLPNIDKEKFLSLLQASITHSSPIMQERFDRMFYQLKG